ncbi:hypothetical protein [Staphylococcus hyicus]|uniref:hypothetical protein n=1 Tax=Staphylococcus hyicus TaxID=1284 RepID=UPI002365A489|nr:hypothetical protein [Staphylococcus hyicus]
MEKALALLIALVTTFVVAVPFAFEAYFTTTLTIATWTMIGSYYAVKYVIQTLKKTAS